MFRNKVENCFGRLCTNHFRALVLALSGILATPAVAVDVSLTVIDEMPYGGFSAHSIAINDLGHVVWLGPDQAESGTLAIWSNLSGTPELLLEPTPGNNYESIFSVNINNDGSIVFEGCANAGGPCVTGLFAIPRDQKGDLDPANANALTDFILGEPPLAGAGLAGISGFIPGYTVGSSGTVYASGQEPGINNFHIYAGHVDVLGDTDGVTLVATNGFGHYSAPAINGSDVLAAHIFAPGLIDQIFVGGSIPARTVLDGATTPFQPAFWGRGGLTDTGDIAFTGGFFDAQQVLLGMGLYSMHIDDTGFETLKLHAASNSAYKFISLPSINEQGHATFNAELDDFRRGVFAGPDPVGDAVLAANHSFLGSTVHSLAGFPLSKLNESDQVAMIVSLTDGRDVVVRADLSNFSEPYCDGPQCDELPMVDETLNVMNMMTGSPVSASQEIDTPATPFSVSFDHRFLTETGTLEVKLGGVSVGSVTEPHVVDEVTDSASFLVDIPALLGQVGLTLAFVLDGTSGSQVQVSGISLDGVPPEFETGFVNGDFGTGDFTGWTIDTSAGGDIMLFAIDVPAGPPGAPAIFADGFE